MSTHSISVAHSKLVYQKTGSGPHPLLLFHGFGQTHRAFQPLFRLLEKEYTLYTFDLFFHGESTWAHDEHPLEKAHWKELLTAFFHQHNIDQFSLLGFSMGGKFALVTMEAFAERTRDIFLLAPDGIKTSFWYSLATYPLAFRKLFKSMINRPQRFEAMAAFAARMRWIDRGVLRFVETQMNSPEKRARVYYSWVVFRHLSVPPDRVASIVNQHRIPLTLLVGRYDKIITANNMQGLLKKLDQPHLEILDAGHNDLIAQAAVFFAARLSQKVPE